MQNYYQFMVPRLNGEEIKKNFSRYRSLVRKGIAGFIVFGGELETVRTYVRELQQEAALPLIISSDLERGLGQQLKGGTDFPPAMALAAAYKKLSAISYQLSAIRLLRRSFRAVAKEAKYAGINTIYAPVLDINTNPKNPIIAVRAFGEDPATVSLLGIEMIRALQRSGIAACGKHFPGHGDTAVDSHIRLPVLHQDLKRLKRYELKPFAAAIEAGVKMIMLGHLSVPALDASGTPVSFSEKAVQFLRRDMGYDGLLITDALNMGGIGNFSEEEASIRALEAGVDILLHPSDADKVAAYLARMNTEADPTRLLKFRKRLKPLTVCSIPPFESHARLSERLTRDAITGKRRFSIKGTPLLVMLNDEAGDKAKTLGRLMKQQQPGIRVFELGPRDSAQAIRKHDDETLIVAIFSETKAWKGGASNWLYNMLGSLRSKADLFVSFGSPYLLDGIEKIPCLYAYWDSLQSQEAVAEFLLNIGTH